MPPPRPSTPLLVNRGNAACTLPPSRNAYQHRWEPLSFARLLATTAIASSLKQSANWYDFTVRVVGLDATRAASRVGSKPAGTRSATRRWAAARSGSTAELNR